MTGEYRTRTLPATGYVRPPRARTRRTPSHTVTTLDAQALATLTGRHERTARRALAAAARENPAAVRVVRTGRPGRPRRELVLDATTPATP